MARNPLDEAESLYRNRRWPQLISLLEPMSEMYRDTARFSVLLGNAYLHKEDIGGAYSCFRRAQSLDFRDTEAALGLAAVSIRRGDSDKAVHLYIEILERSPRNKKAIKGLEFLRQTAVDETTFPAKKIRGLYPEPPYRWRAAIVALSACAVLGVGIWLAPVILRGVRETLPRRDGVSDIVLSIEEQNAPVGSDGGFDFILTEKLALATFEKAKNLFTDYRDEAALVELNRLRLSNATRQVKAKASSLALYVREPSFLSMPDRYSLADVAANPRLYEGVGIIWKGLVANVATANTAVAPGSGTATTVTTFDLLVGYHDKKRLEGIVQVRAGFQASLTPDRPIEVLARVRNIDGNAFYLECLAIHEQ
jgi:tetratricopeptide (TPR) repeat protein